MLRLTVRVLLLLSVLALGRVVVSGFLRSDERNEVTVNLMQEGRCTSEAFAQNYSKGN